MRKMLYICSEFNKETTMKKIFLSIFSLLLLAGVSGMRASDAGVPSECEDVMLQAFYWNSYDQYKSTTKYNYTKWVQLIKDTAAINANFDLVWLPPSAKSKGGVGYYHTQLSNQDSDWGTKTNLTKLITALHAGKTKVIADIVINHRGDISGWTTFSSDNFGDYGKFDLNQSHICAGDEAFTNSSSPQYGSSNHGGNDTGTNDPGARDMDHSSTFVQNWAKAYTQWMLNVMKYDGFRYDMTRGYAGKYLKMYNETAKPYLSVSEFWTGIDEMVTHLQATDYNTMVFDFPLKGVLHDAIVKSSYGKLKKNSYTMRGKGLEKYAVTFIDNHDTFERPEEDACNQEFGGCRANLDDAKVKNWILQANAYILMMPGVPCVFWPHWYKYREEINELIAIRKLAGIHSESKVSAESGNSSSKAYSGTIAGHRANLILRLGPKRSTDVPEGYRLALEGGDRGDYTIFISDGQQGVESVESRVKRGEKFMQDGKLFIRVNENIYDITGKKIQ